MKKLLITGFEPFGGEDVNASWLAVSSLPERIADFDIIKREIPVVFGKAAEYVISESLGADIILCVGQAGGRDKITPEFIGINMRKARIPDNMGNQPDVMPCVPGGPDGLFSTLPVHSIAGAISAEGIPCEVSYSAGTYVCNDTLYSLLEHFRGIVPVGFIHIPLLPEQAKGEKPSLELEKDIRALEIAVKTISAAFAGNKSED